MAGFIGQFAGRQQLSLQVMKFKAGEYGRIPIFGDITLRIVVNRVDGLIILKDGKLAKIIDLGDHLSIDVSGGTFIRTNKTIEGVMLSLLQLHRIPQTIPYRFADRDQFYQLRLKNNDLTKLNIDKDVTRIVVTPIPWIYERRINELDFQQEPQYQIVIHGITEILTNNTITRALYNIPTTNYLSYYFITGGIKQNVVPEGLYLNTKRLGDIYLKAPPGDYEITVYYRTFLARM